MILKMLITGVGTMAVRSMPLEPLPVGRGRADAVVSAAPHAMEMVLSPINADWILSGEPVARMSHHSRSGDRASYTALWDCTAGSFRWFFEWDETVHILEGEVHVTAEDGSVHLLRAGDVAYFKAGTWAIWRVDKYVRKVAFLRRPFPWPIAFAYRVKNKLFSTRSRSF